MSCKIVVLFLLRIIIFLFAGGTLACHVAQLVLLSQQDGPGNWWPGYVPYILYYVGPIVSILSVIILFFLACFHKSLLGDRVMSVINLLLCIAIVVYNSLQAGMIPWNGALPKQFASNDKGWATYCDNYNDGTGLIKVRCWLQNGTWLGMIVLGFFWLLMALYTVVQRNSDVYNEDYDAYDYKDDVPMADTRKTSSIQHLASPVPQQKHQPYMSPSTPHHHSFIANNNSSTPIVTDNSNYYYQQQQHQLYDTNNDYNNEYYLNPVQEEHMNNHSHHNVAAAAMVDPNNGYERSRKVSKTFLEEDFHSNNNSNISPSGSVQPPHSYDGYKAN